MVNEVGNSVFRIMEARPLFSKHGIFRVIQTNQQQAQEAVQQIPSDTLLGTSPDDIVNALVDRFRLDVPVIQDAAIYIADTCEVPLDVRNDPRRMVSDRSKPCYVPAHRTVIAIPFEGDPACFDIEPPIHSLNPPRAMVQDRELLLTDTRTGNDAEALKRDYTRTLDAIKGCLQRLAESVGPFNATLPGLIRSACQDRKQKLLDSAGMTAALGLPIKRRADAPSAYTVPVQRKHPRIELPTVDAPFQPEPVLSTADYDDILATMRSMARVMELSPVAFLEMGEQDLRTHFLVALNAQFEGGATGETFNFQGRTDILIRANNRNVFVAECKFWAGEVSMDEAISQLLSYLSWRDTKAALLVFNRSRDFSRVLETLATVAGTHPCFEKDLGRKDETTFSYLFHQPNEPTRKVLLTVMAFDIPTAVLQPSNRKRKRYA